MSEFMVHLHRAPDGTLPTDKWIAVHAANKYDALANALRLPENKGLQPVEAFVSLGKMRHEENGTPIAVTGFSLEWGGKKGEGDGETVH